MTSFTKTLTRVLAAGAAVVLLSACVANTSGQLALPKDVAKQGTYYVQRQPADERDLASLIAKNMQGRSMQATAGPESARPADVAYVVTYVDKWMWDMRMYLYDLRIEVRDAKDQSILGYGQSMQSSLKAMGQSHEDVIDTALDQLFGPN